MKNKLFRNWGLKLLSVFIAFFAWIAVMTYADPITNRTLPNIPINVINGDVIEKTGNAYNVEGRLYTNVKVSGVKSIVNSLTTADFAAQIDISKMFDVTGQVPVELSCRNSRAASLTYSPVTTTVKVNIERILTKSIPITVTTSGNLPDGYLLGDVTARPRTVQVNAPESVMERIASVRVNINIDGLTDNASFECPLRYYSEGGSLLNFDNAEHTGFSIDSTTVTAEIWTMKIVPVVIAVSGQSETASGFRYTGAMQSLNTIKVSGLRSRLAALNAISIPEEVLSVAGADGAVTYEVPLKDYLPEGISLVSGQDETLKVTLTVEPLIIKTYSLPAVNIVGRTSGYTYTVTSKSLSIQLRALEEDFKGITEDHIKAEIDVTDLTPGDYRLKVDVSCDEVFELMGTLYANINIKDPTVPKETVPASTEAAESKNVPATTEAAVP